MKQFLTAIPLLALLAACGDGQPFTFSDGEEEPVIDDDEEVVLINGVPEALANNLTQVSYNANANTLTVAIQSLDTTPVVATYTRNAPLDVPGYTAYSVQEDALDRMFIAFVAESRDGTSEAVLVSDGGQFNRFFSGISYSRNGNYSEPNSGTRGGLVSYAGDYVGLSNLSAPRPGAILPVPGGTDPALIPQQAPTVTGQVFINADFADNSVNGAVFDRFDIDNNVAMPDVIMVVTDIESDGTFFGTTENRAQDSLGTYGGIFGGVGATSVSGGIQIENYLDEIESEQEYGIFVLQRCGTNGDPSICDGL